MKSINSLHKIAAPLALLLTTLAVAPAIATTPEARGLEIATEADRRDLGFEDFAAELTMTLRNRHGEESSRSLRSSTLEQQDDGDKSLVVFDSPRDIDGTATFVIERYPVDPRSGYTRQVVWLDQEEYRPLRIDFFDRKDALLKTLTFSGYQQYVDQYWRPATMEMVNHQTGKSTVLEWQNYKFRNGLAEADFNRAALARAR